MYMLETFHLWGMAMKKYLIVDRPVTVTATICPHHSIYLEVSVYRNNEDISNFKSN